jgi:phosphotransferase system enzyme I (PtsP)
VGICGELAGDPGGAVLLLAMGYHVLSMNATSLPKVKKALRNLRLTEARDLLRDVMALENAFEINQRLEDFLVTHGMAQFIHSPVE